jgi:hypothetical protein
VANSAWLRAALAVGLGAAAGLLADYMVPEAHGWLVLVGVVGGGLVAIILSNHQPP